MMQKLSLHLMQKGFRQPVIQLILDELPTDRGDEEENAALQKRVNDFCEDISGCL